MGFAASQARLLMLTARKSDLELQLQFVNQARMMIANQMGSLTNQQLQSMQVNDPRQMENPGFQQQQQQMQQRNNAQMTMIQQMDKMLEMEGRRLDTQHQAVQTEVEAVNKVISKNIESSFKLMG